MVHDVLCTKIGRRPVILCLPKTVEEMIESIDYCSFEAKVLFSWRSLRGGGGEIMFC